MADLTDEAVKALLDRGEQLYNDAKHHIPLQARCADLARALLEARAENARLRADAEAAVALVVTDAVGKLKDWEFRLSAVGKSDAAYYVDLSATIVRALATVDGLAEVAKLRKERDAVVTARDMMGNLWAEAKADLAAAQEQIEAMRVALSGWVHAIDEMVAFEAANPNDSTKAWSQRLDALEAAEDAARSAIAALPAKEGE